MGLPGFVYVLLNPAFPGLVKIGRTERQVDTRVRELRSTGVPSKFLVLWQEHVSDADTVEKRLRARFAGYRYENDREFFSVPPQEAIRALMNESRALVTSLPMPIASADVLEHLRLLLGDALCPDIVSASLKQDANVCYLETVRWPSQPHQQDEIVEKIDLSIVSGLFRPTTPFKENLIEFMQLDPVTLAAVTDVIRPEIAKRIYESHVEALWNQPKLR